MDHEGKLTVSIKTAAEMLSVGRNTIYKLINTGKLKVVHFGDRTLIPIAELENLVRDQTTDDSEIIRISRIET